MTRKKQVDASSAKERPRRGVAASALKTLQLPLLNILQDPDLIPAGDPSSHERHASIVEEHKMFCSAQVNVPSPARFNAPEYELKFVGKELGANESKLKILQQVCDAIDAEVRSRSATIRAMSAAQVASSKPQLDLQISKFSTEELNMPLEEYLKTCRGITAVRRSDGTIQLQKRSSPYPKLEDSKRNLQDLLTKAKDGASTNSSLFTPCAEPNLPATESVPRQHNQQEKLLGEELSWPEYCKRLQNLGFNAALTPGLESDSKFTTPMIFKGGAMTGVTPKTLRLPKPGETMLSINGSPLGQFGKTPATTGPGTRARKSRLASSKKSLRDL